MSQDRHTILAELVSFRLQLLLGVGTKLLGAFLNWLELLLGRANTIVQLSNFLFKKPFQVWIDFISIQGFDCFSRFCYLSFGLLAALVDVGGLLLKDRGLDS